MGSSSRRVSLDLRVECPHGERCAGCTRLGEPYGEQLVAKRERVAAALQAYPVLAGVQVAEVEGADAVEGYRTRAKWMVGEGGELGLYDRGGQHRVVDIAGCRVVAPVIARVGQAVRAMVGRARAGEGPVWARPHGAGGALRAIDVREVRRGGEARALLTLVVAAGEGVRAPTIDEAREAAKALRGSEPAIAGVALNVARGDALQVLGAETTWLDGEREVLDEGATGATRVSFGSFVQAHRGQAARVHAWLQGEVRGLSVSEGKHPRVLELFGGAGAMAMALASGGVEVVTVESFVPASEAAARAAREVGASVTAMAGDAGERCAALARAGERFDLVVVNPPRRGLSPALREALAALDAPRVVYVSCEPSTLARDLEHLARLGYGASKIRPLDMIPLTDEVESVVTLTRRGVAAPRVLVDMGSAVFVEKGAHEPVTPQGEYVVSLLERVRRLPGLAAAVPVQRLEVGVSGACLFARTADDAAAWGAALRAANITFLAGAKGVVAPKGATTRGLREGDRVVEARLRYRRVALHLGHSIVLARPDDGRAATARRLLAGLGHPVIGDERHGHAPTNRHFSEKHGLDRPFLHCLRVEMVAPEGSRVVAVCPASAELPLPQGFDPTRKPEGEVGASRG